MALATFWTGYSDVWPWLVMIVAESVALLVPLLIASPI
jgi:hypothetical protein